MERKTSQGLKGQKDQLRFNQILLVGYNDVKYTTRHR